MAVNYLLTISLVFAQIVGFFLIWGGLWLAIAFPLFSKLGWRPLQPIASDQKLKLLIPLYLLAPLILWGALRVTHQSWESIGVELSGASGRSLLMGWSFAVVGLLAILIVKRGGQFVTFHLPPDITSSRQAQFSTVLTVLGLLPLALWLGGIEELVFRGWLQTQLEVAFAPWLAAVVGSGLFAIAHLLWDGRAGLRQQPGLWALGMVLVFARWLDGGSLALAWGLHAGWVWGLACMGEFIRPEPVPDKPVWLTGVAAQPLTDIFDLSLLGVTASLLWLTSTKLG
jgi:membrane protease YdiL (CAAX protease family)